MGGKNSEQVHRTILFEAWQIVWRNKKFWILGFFAAFWGNAGLFRAFNSLIDAFGGSPGSLPAKLGVMQNLPNILDKTSPWAIIFLILGVAIICFIFWLTVASRGGLIKAVADLRKKKIISCREAWHEGTEKFWRVLFLSLLAKILAGLLLLGLAGLMTKFLWHFSWLTAPFYLLGFVLLSVLLLLISFLVVFALSYAVLDNAGFWKSISRAIDLFFRNWLISAELGVIIYVLSFVLGIGLAVAGLVLAMPVLLILVIALFLNAPFLFWLVAGPAALIFFLLFLAAGAAFATFELTAWVLLFQRLTEGGAVAKLIRLFSRKEV